MKLKDVIITILVCMLAMQTMACWYLSLSSRSLKIKTKNQITESSRKNHDLELALIDRNNQNAQLIKEKMSVQSKLDRQSKALQILLNQIQTVQALSELDLILNKVGVVREVKPEEKVEVPTDKRKKR